MSRTLRLTQQSIDPIGAISSAGITWIAGGFATLLALGVTLSRPHEIGNPVAAVLGVLLVVAAALVAATGTAPRRAPFSTERLALVTILGLGGAIAEYVSTAGRNGYLYDDYGPAAIGLLLISLAPFCTWTALLAAGGFATGIQAFMVLGLAFATTESRPLAGYVVVIATSGIAFSVAAAAYSATVVADILAWQRETNREVLRRDRRMQEGVDTSGDVSRVTMLRREVLPFLAQVMTADRISVHDADRARELAESLRRAMRAGIDSTWLDDLADALTASEDIPVVVDDLDAEARHLLDDQRATVTALIVFLASAGHASRVSVHLSRSDDESGVELRVEADGGADVPTRRELDRFTAVAYSVGLGATASVERDRATVSFSYLVD